MKLKTAVLSLFLITTICFLQMPVKSQTVPDYHSLKELEKYYGTWIYEANGKYFKIVLKKQVYTDNHDGYKTDFVVGSYIYKENGVTISGKLDSEVNSIKTGHIQREPKDENILSFRFSELNRFVTGRGFMKYKDGEIPLLIWTLGEPENRQRVIINGNKEPTLKFVVPQQMTLKKIKDKNY